MSCPCAVERFGNVFWGKVTQDRVACFGSLPLSAAPKGKGHTPARTLWQGAGRETAGQGSSDGLRGACTRDTGRGEGGLLSLHHSRTQQRQNLWRLPPTEGGGVTGAKYACTLMLGRWVCGEERRTSVLMSHTITLISWTHAFQLLQHNICLLKSKTVMRSDADETSSLWTEWSLASCFSPLSFDASLLVDGAAMPTSELNLDKINKSLMMIYLWNFFRYCLLFKLLLPALESLVELQCLVDQLINRAKEK